VIGFLKTESLFFQLTNTRMQWFLCSDCEEWETYLSKSMIDNPEEYICCYCFEHRAIEEQDELSLMISSIFEKEVKFRAKMRRAKK